MPRVLFVLLIFLISFSSCSLEARLDRKEDRLVGRWVFHKAWYKDNNALFRDNIFNEFAGDIVEFYYDYEASYDDASRRQFYWGEWDIFAQRERRDDDDIDFFLDMYFFDDRGFESFSYIGECTLLTRNKLHIRAYDRGGEYIFRLRRVD